MIFGIDNGVTTGGIVVLSDHPGPPIAMTTFPVQKPRSRSEVDIKALSDWICSIEGSWPVNALFVIEEPNNSRNPSTAYSVASCFHALRGMFEIKNANWRRITPQSWQKEMLGKVPTGRTKAAAEAKTLELWPTELWRETPRCTTKHRGLIDAALIAEYGRIKNL